MFTPTLYLCDHHLPLRPHPPPFFSFTNTFDSLLPIFLPWPRPRPWQRSVGQSLGQPSSVRSCCTRGRPRGVAPALPHPQVQAPFPPEVGARIPFDFVRLSPGRRNHRCQHAAPRDASRPAFEKGNGGSGIIPYHPPVCSSQAIGRNGFY